MSRSPSSALSPLTTLLGARRGTLLPLPPRLERLYGPLRMAPSRTRAHVFSNFVTTLDGVVSLAAKGHASGGDISGFNAQDRMVMGMLRAIADVVVVGAGTLDQDRRHVWTAEAIFPEFARDYRQLATSLGKQGPPLNVIVSGSGDIDLRLPVFTSGKVKALILTTRAGYARLGRQHTPANVEIRSVRTAAGAGGHGGVAAGDILDAVGKAIGGKPGGRRILVEGGPRLLGDFYARGLVDEQFLTLAAQIAGRDADDGRLSLVMGKLFAPRKPLWGKLMDARSGGSHLFLRYSFAT